MGIEFLFLFVLVIFEIIFFLSAVFILISGLISEAKGAPYVPLPRKFIKEILDFAEIKDARNFCDLGCGDGRVLIQAVKNFGVKNAVGYEISPWPYLKARFLINQLGFKDKIRILREDFFEADLNKADMVFIYLYPKIVQNLTPKFGNELRRGAKIVSVSFPIKSPEEFNLKLIKSGKIDRFGIYLYGKV